MRILIIPLSLMLCGFAPPSIETNNQGVKSFNEENYNEAFNKFADALSKDPESPIMHFNLANTFHKNGQTPKALTELEAVEAMPQASADAKYMAMFNAGNMAVEAKDLTKAMGYYQKALQYKPDSQEVKTNIELALRDPQGGGGGGKDDEKKEKQDQKQDQKENENKDENKGEKKEQKPDQGQRPKPKPFQSKDLNEADVKRILEELKRQENEIRAKNQKKNKNAEVPQSGKDW